MVSFSYGGSRVRLIPSKVIVWYDDTYFKSVYPSYYDKNIDGDLGRNESVYEYQKGFVSETPLIREKRDVIDEEIVKII